MISPENIHVSNIIWNQQALFRTISVYTNRYIHAIIVKMDMHLKEGKEEYMRRFGGKEGRNDIIHDS